jgi:hypothetical protein
MEAAMERSQRSSSGVLGPVGLLLVAVLWLMTISGNVPSKNLAASPATPQTGHVDQTPVPTVGGSTHNRLTLTTHPAGLTTHPATLPGSGAGA